jgi:hypothetical protein
MGERANLGDKVRFWCWENEGYVEGIVEYVPTAPGDSWVIVEDDGSIVHINMFYGMRVLSRKV